MYHKGTPREEYILACGLTVVGVFGSQCAARGKLEKFAGNIGMEIKKGHREAPQKPNTSKAPSGKIMFLKPGEFKLPA